MSSRRKVAVVLDGPQTPAWQARALALLEASPALEVVSVVRLPARPPGLARRARRAFERRLFIWAVDPLAAVDVPASARGEDADLTLWLAAAEPRGAGPLLEVRHGPLREDAVLAFRRALAAGDAVVAAEAILHDGADRRVVARAVSAVKAYSLWDSVNLALWRAASLAARAAAACPGLDEPLADVPPAAAPPPPAPVRTTVAWARVLLVRLLYRRPWEVRVRTRRPEPTAGWSDDERLVAWRRGHVYADPFLFEHEGRHHLFCEEIPAGSGWGVISHVELAHGGVAAPEPVLSEEHHLSYPFVFAHEGEVYMLAESARAAQVRLYRATRFPEAWELDRVLLDGVRAADPTLLEAHGRWWLFASVGERGSTLGDELHIYTAASPLGPWGPHPGNPVVSDIRRGRPAGAFLDDDGRLLRVAQDGSRRYGFAVTFQEVVELSGERYAEREVARLEPTAVAGARAVHAYSRDSRYEAIDVRRRVRRWSVPGRRDRGE